MQTCTKASTNCDPWESGKKLEKRISEMVGKWKDQSLYSWSGKIYFQKGIRSYLAQNIGLVIFFLLLFLTRDLN